MNFENENENKNDLRIVFLTNCNALVKNSKSIIIEHVLKSKSFIEFKKLKFRKYINFSCKIHFSDETELETCYDNDSKFSLISAEVFREYYFSTKIFRMKNDQKIRCEKIEGRKKFDL